MNSLTPALLAMCLTVAAPSAQSLRDLAKQQGGTATSMMDCDYPLLNTGQLLARSDLVLHCQIVGVRVRLSPGETYVVTEYELAPLRVLKQNRTLTSASPGQTAQLIVTRPGGTLMDGPYRLSTSVGDFPEAEMFRLGEEAILFLLYRPETGAYVFTAGALGAFRVTKGTVHPVTGAVARRRGDRPMSIEAFVDGFQRSPGDHW